MDQRRSKVKTGCATCRIRKVKCDENKPFCLKCVKSGRSCDGYESPFRPFVAHSTNNRRAVHITSKQDLPCLRATLPKIAAQDIDLLNRCFHTKTTFDDVELGCSEEARQVLEASLTDPAIRHAISSLKALRQDFETSGDVPASVAQQTPGYDHGLEQYCMALRGLASDLSSLGPNGLKSALLCCQIFISIEQVREHYAVMAQHIIQGLRIMHEHGARPSLGAARTLVPAHQDQLPLLDVFVIKLFAAPCKFAERTKTTATADESEMESMCPISQLRQHADQGHHLRTIAPDMRADLIKIANRTLEFLQKVSKVESAEDALRLLSEKESLLDSLESWLMHLELVYNKTITTSPEPVAISFLRFFHQILKLVLLASLDSTVTFHGELQPEIDRLQSVASNVGERVQAYRMDIRATRG